MKRVSCAPFTFCTWKDCFHSAVNKFFIRWRHVNHPSTLERNLMERNLWLGGDYSEARFMRPLYILYRGGLFSLRCQSFFHQIKKGQLSFASPRTKPNLIEWKRNGLHAPLLPLCIWRDGSTQPEVICPPVWTTMMPSL